MESTSKMQIHTFIRMCFSSCNNIKMIILEIYDYIEGTIVLKISIKIFLMHFQATFYLLSKMLTSLTSLFWSLAHLMCFVFPSLFSPDFQLVIIKCNIHYLFTKNSCDPLMLCACTPCPFSIQARQGS